jgi:hypothetical protein
MIVAHELNIEVASNWMTSVKHACDRVGSD